MCRNIDEDQDMYKMAVPASSFKLGDSSRIFSPFYSFNSNFNSPIPAACNTLDHFEKFRVYHVHLCLDLLGKSVVDMTNCGAARRGEHGEAWS